MKPALLSLAYAKAFLCTCILLCTCFAGAQCQYIVHRIDEKSGLPDQHVYGAITDRLGYLWLATPKGVVKYNGYHCTVMGTAEGLPTGDNWRLLEDSTGRLWLSNVSYEVGYLKNDRYHCAMRFDRPVYPRPMIRHGKGVVMLSKDHYLSSNQHECRFIVIDGEHSRSTKLPLPRADFLQLSASGDLLVHHNKESLRCYGIDRQGRISSPSAFLPFRLPMEDLALLFHHYLCSFSWETPFFHVMPVLAGSGPARYCFLSAADERVVYAYELDDHFYVISNKKVYLYDTAFRLCTSYSISELSAGDKVSDRQYCIYNHCPVWGDLLSTTDKGVYRRTQQPVLLSRKAMPDLAACRFAGASDSLGYWWSEERQQLSIVSRSVVRRRYDLPGIRKLQQVEAFSGDTLLLACRDHNFLFGGGKLMAGGRHLDPLDSIVIVSCAVSPGKKVFLIYGGSVPQLTEASFAGSRVIGPVPAKQMSYDRVRHGLWLYHSLGLAFYDITSGRLQELPHATLRSMGIRNVEAVLADPVYGNVFVKDLDKIWLLAEDIHSVQPVLPRYRHLEARMLLNGNRLIVGGRMGLLSLPLLGKGQLGIPDVYENTKDHYYRTLSTLQVCGNHALMKTDRGFYELNMDRPAQPPGTASLIAILADTSCKLKDGDELLLPPGARNLRLDLVRPEGRGQPAFSYSWVKDQALLRAANNEIGLEHLKPYRRYRLCLQAHDDVWNGELLHVGVRILPQWWQTRYFITAILLLALLLALLLVLLTRRVVLKKQLEKQLMLELSLDATYARINPHFIFNALSTAQYHIRSNNTVGAARYISRFSRLLRSYLKSSRQRYISVRDEMLLLEDYILLQQERFEHRFSYSITADEQVDRSLEIPALLLQPFVENAIRHGLWLRQSAGHLSVSFQAAKDGHLRICIDDNGIGRARARALSGEKESFGDELAGRLVKLFNTYEKIKLHILYTDKVLPHTGTLVTITIQYPSK